MNLINCNKPQEPILFQSDWPKNLDPAKKSIFSKMAQVGKLLCPPIWVVRYIQQVAWSIVIPGQIATEEGGFIKLMGRFLTGTHNCSMKEEGEELLQALKGENIQFLGADNALVDGAFFKGAIKNKVILLAHGNGSQWEVLGSIIGRFLKTFGVSVFTINPRKIGESTGTRSSEGYALDYYSAYEYLIYKKGIDPKDILLVGFSMGAANGVCGASLIQEKYPDKEISVISVCSFSNLTTEISFFANKITALMAQVFGIEVQAEKAFRTLKGQKGIFFIPSDDVIPKEASLAATILKGAQDPNTTIVEMTSNLAPFNQWPAGEHNRPFTTKEQQVFDRMVRNFLHLSSWSGWMPLYGCLA